MKQKLPKYQSISFGVHPDYKGTAKQLEKEAKKVLAKFEKDRKSGKLKPVECKPENFL